MPSNIRRHPAAARLANGRQALDFVRFAIPNFSTVEANAGQLTQPARRTSDARDY